MSVGDLWWAISGKQVVEFYDKDNELIWQGSMVDIDIDMWSEKIRWLIIEPTGCLEIFIEGVH